MRARSTATWFLAGYLPFVYGRGPAHRVPATTPAFRSQLTRTARITPTARQRRPRVISLTAAGEAPGVVLATALIDDGGITAYTLRIMLHAGRSGWQVSGVDGG